VELDLPEPSGKAPFRESPRGGQSLDRSSAPKRKAPYRLQAENVARTLAAEASPGKQRTDEAATGRTEQKKKPLGE
jgi:hypothetical protein